MPDGVVAEDGFIGREALSLRDAASQAAARQIAQAETLRDAARQEADERFSVQRSEIEQTLNEFLNSIRRGTLDAELAETLELSDVGVSATVAASLGATQTAARTQAVPVMLSEAVERLNGGRTQMQREEFWEKAEGRPISISGRVYDIKGSGFLTSATIEIDVDARNVRVSCLIESEYEEKLISINVGDRFNCEGKLFNYVFLFDTLSISVNHAIIQ
jgi:hypothetical protein